MTKVRGGLDEWHGTGQRPAPGRSAGGLLVNWRRPHRSARHQYQAVYACRSISRYAVILLKDPARLELPPVPAPGRELT